MVVNEVELRNVCALLTTTKIRLSEMQSELHKIGKFVQKKYAAEEKYLKFLKSCTENKSTMKGN